ncbi:Major Facilitator Superfamily protein [Dethiosulfatibacter aminovorans DSM 17477]|uniref:Major Facilitator Superfamily protein n=1 Tax=Dethiosulfatibacter aminovorans DSM 17477 TaxID=1121476 RepID=A0A1M6JPP6_9FIRM|nr:Major Facilitator Superfamily protein [Dethiosulfatibacter aminovorans DSM 17477]
MSIVGISFGLAGTAGFIGATLLNKVLSVSQIFLSCSIFTVFTGLYIAIFIREYSIKNIEKKVKLKAGMLTKDMIKLMSGGFFIYYSMVSVFMIVPQIIDRTVGIGEMWKFFIPGIILGIFSMRISAKLADRGHEKKIVRVSFLVLVISLCCLLADRLYLVEIGLTSYFIGYMCLVSLFPATVTKFSPQNSAGTVAGVFNTVQFMGSFSGGLLTGVLWGISKNTAVYGLIALCVITTLIVNTVQSYSPEHNNIKNEIGVI